MSTASYLDRLFDPLQEVLDAKSARAILGWRADATLQARLNELADKSTEGTLTSQEREEYDAYVRAIDFIGILQAKARQVVKRSA